MLQKIRPLFFMTTLVNVEKNVHNFFTAKSRKELWKKLTLKLPLTPLNLLPHYLA